MAVYRVKYVLATKLVNELVEAADEKQLTKTISLLRRAADDALLGFTDADLQEQAHAISTGKPYVLRVTVT